jgi:hypothetical protein
MNMNYPDDCPYPPEQPIIRTTGWRNYIVFGGVIAGAVGLAAVGFYTYAQRPAQVASKYRVQVVSAPLPK